MGGGAAIGDPASAEPSEGTGTTMIRGSSFLPVCAKTADEAKTATSNTQTARIMRRRYEILEAGVPLSRIETPWRSKVTAG